MSSDERGAWATDRTWDLPPLRDGNPVEWTEWAVPPVTTLPLHRPRPARAECCPRCSHDQVIDGAGVAWDLDESDYLNEGSWQQ